MQITEMLLTNKNARPGTRITPRGLVIHWTANESKGANAVANRNYFNNPTTEASAHYIVDDRQIIRCLPENEMGYHVGAKSYKPNALTQLSTYPNNCTIGIEMCVNIDGDFHEMYQKTLELVADILKRYGWGVNHLWRHFDITGKNCPAYFVSDDYARKFMGMTASQAWDKLKGDVNKMINPQPNAKPVDKNADTKTQAALKVLQAAGVIQTPDYWIQNAFDGGLVKGEYAALLIQNMASKLGGTKPEQPPPTTEPDPEPEQPPVPSKEPKDWKAIEELTKAASLYVDLMTDGTAVLLKDGYVLTAQHVSKGKPYLNMKMATKHVYRATLVAEHPGIGKESVDLALYRLESAPSNLPYLPLATDKLQLGEKLMSVESEYTKQIVRTGEVCVLSNATWPWKFAASIPVDHGNSGGAAVNQYGELIGIAIQYEYVTINKGSVSQGTQGGCFINLLYTEVANWLKQYVK